MGPSERIRSWEESEMGSEPVSDIYNIWFLVGNLQEKIWLRLTGKVYHQGREKQEKRKKEDKRKKKGKRDLIFLCNFPIS